MERNNSTITKEQKELYNALKERGVPALLNKWDGHKHIDIAIPEARVNIEVDGAQHNLDFKQALADLKRTYCSFKEGYLTLRIPNVLIRDKIILKETADLIMDFLSESNEQLDEE